MQSSAGKCPRLRSDLVVSRQETPEGIFFVVKDPKVGRFVRFKEPEFLIARQLDGDTPLEEVRQRSELQFDAPIAPATLEQFARKLQTLGLLETEEAPPQHAGHSARRVRGSVLYLRLK